MTYLMLLCAFMLGMLAGLIGALLAVCAPLDGIVKTLTHTPKG